MEHIEAANAIFGQVLVGIQNVVEQQNQLFLRALEARETTATSQRKRSDVPWPVFSAEKDETVRTWLHQMEHAFR